jgi:carbamoyl-phosphate synthase large subunit
MKENRVFISGGSGVIGTALVNRLLQEGAQVFVGDLKPCPMEWMGKVYYRQGDLNCLTRDELQDFSPDLIFHLAATFERSEETGGFFEENFHHNVQLSHHLIECVKECPSIKKMVFASSYLIYDPLLYQFNSPPDFPTILKEDSSIYPRNICGAAKFFHELELRFLQDHFKGAVSFISARIFRVYGRGSKDVISRWIRSALRKETLNVYRPEGKFDYIFADDVAEGLWRLSKTDYSGIVNLGSGKSNQVEEVIQCLRMAFPDLKTVYHQSSILCEASQAGMEKFESLTNWLPQHSLKKGIFHLIEFEKNQIDQMPRQELGSLLITSISRKIPLIQAVRSAGKKIKEKFIIHGCDSQSNCIGRYKVDQFWHCPSLETLTIQEVIHYCHLHQIQVIIPTRDADLLFYARYQDQLQENGIQVMISSLKTIETCLNKRVFAEILSQHLFPVIPTSSNFKEIEDLSDSYVVKERDGAGSLQVGINLSKEKIIEQSRQLAHPIFQPYIKGKEWSIDLYRTRTGITKGVVARSRDVVVNGESQITTTAHHPALEKLCEELAHDLQIQGHAVFQVIEDAQGQFHVIECNPRFGGASTLSLAVGLDSFYWFLLESLGVSLEDYPFIRAQGEKRQIRYPVDSVIPW